MSEKFPNLRNRRVLIAMCGAVSASIMPSWVLWMLYGFNFASIRIILSQAASNFVSRQALEAITKQRVFIDWDDSLEKNVPHIQLPAESDIFLVMPASANMMGKVAQGIADDLISATIMAAEIPVVFVPSMNGAMWNKAAVQRNVKQLQEDSYHIIEPQYGVEVATGEASFGAMPDFASLMKDLDKILAASLNGTKA